MSERGRADTSSRSRGRGKSEQQRSKDGGRRKKSREDELEMEEEGIDEVEDMEEQEQERGPSVSRQWRDAMNGNVSGKRTLKQAKLNFAVQVEVPVVEQFVPPQVRGSGLDVIQRNSEREEALAVAQSERQGGREGKKKGHELDPANLQGMNSACWIFFRSAKKGEDPRYVYCVACEYVDNGAKSNSASRVAITNYGTNDAHLHATNAKSHLKQHAAWWKVVKDASEKGMDARAAFQDLMNGKKRRVVQNQETLDSHLKKGQRKPDLVEKELRLVIWMVRNRIPFNAVDDSSFKDLLQSFGVQLSSSKTLKRYLLLLSEIALRHAEKQIKKAGSYSIALDYWTSVAKDKYLAITYHYADKKLNVRSRVLDLVAVTGNATALLTSQLVEQRLEKHFEQKRSLFK